MLIYNFFYQTFGMISGLSVLVGVAWCIYDAKRELKQIQAGEMYEAV